MNFLSVKKKIIAQAAEAKIFLINNKIVKSRISKGYRLPFLDKKLRKQRTRKEAKLLQKAASLIPVPRILAVNETQSTIELEYIKGKKLSESLDTLPIEKALNICKLIGTQIATLHDAGIIHGDLTTSNMIFAKEQLYIFDFGLGFESYKTEDKAVDLHLIKEAFEARHFARATAYLKAMIEGYKKSEKAKETMQRLNNVEKRGRYKQQF